MANERTSQAVGTLAGGLLNGRALKAAEAWLHRCASGEATTPEEDTTHALTLIGAVAAVRSVAASALTQRPNKGK
jgi:hypothetical protein